MTLSVGRDVCLTNCVFKFPIKMKAIADTTILTVHTFFKQNYLLYAHHHNPLLIINHS